MSSRTCLFRPPRALHPHLDELLDLAPNRTSYYGPFPWRESEMLDFDRLRAVVADRAVDAETRSFAWAALLETRTPQALALALASYDGGHPHFYPDLDSNLRFVGVARRGDDGSLARITPQRVMHLRFPDESLTRLKPAPANPVHPSWRLVDAPVVIAAAPFGGEAPGMCNCCGGTLHHLITLDPVPADLGVTAVPRIALASCLSCLGWEVHPAMFYEHDAGTGVARDITETPRHKPEFENGPFLETTVAVVETPPRWRWQDWGLANGRENLHRIGGQPCWIQQADVPACPRCRATMSILMQLDSDLPSTTSPEFGWGSGGIAYGFWCDACRVSAWMWQCT